MSNHKRPKRVRGGASFLCSQCGDTSVVLETRRRRNAPRDVLRLRECVSCGHQFHTQEQSFNPLKRQALRAIANEKVRHPRSLALKHLSVAC